MTRQGGHEGVFVKFTTTAGCCCKIELKFDIELTSVRGAASALTGGVADGVGPPAVAEEATALSSDAARALEGVAVPEAGGVGRNDEPA